ncbi:MAG TPA: type IV secretory system conjugative DNA transfer family protein, partial [Candidatus Paceibacterota bacterium]
MADDPNQITYFAQTDSRSDRKKFGIKSADRSKHVYVIGKTGMGKSTLLENMAIQDMQNGNGMAFIDPHGGTAEKLLEYIPESRINDVVYFAPFDIEHPLAFNVMEDVGPERRHLVVSGLMSAFLKLFGEESFSDRMQYILQNIILALLEYPDSTMLGINKMLVDKAYRKSVVDNVTDPSVKAYWTKEFAGYTERFAAEAIPAIQNKIGQFTSNPLIRNIIGQPKSSFNFRKIMDEKKIMIVNLSKGRVGEGNARLLGSMLVTKIYLNAMSRADESAASLSKLPQFYLFVDEFQSFADKSFADILSEARKYKLNLTMAHQYIEQMEEEVRDAVFGNVGTVIAFRVGAYDAEVLEKEFAPVFILDDLVNLGLRQIYLKLMIDSLTSQPFSATTLPPIDLPSISYVKEVIESSRRVFGRPKLEVEKAIVDW